MSRLKFTLIGSGSQFTDLFLQELFKAEELRGCTLALLDRQPGRLAQEIKLAQSLNAAVGWDVTIEGYTEREAALEGATFVYSYVAVNNFPAWKKQFEIANKYGIYPLEAYTTGSASLGFAMRHVPILLDLCADMERICPDAWLIIESNPLAKLVAAVQRHTRIKHVGYCNGHELVQTALEQLLDMSERDPATLGADPLEREYMIPAGTVQLTLAGINHCQWLLGIRSTATGQDLYPLLRERIENPEFVPNGYRFSAQVCRRLGYFPSPADNHVADYIWCMDRSVVEWLDLKKIPVEAAMEMGLGGMNQVGWAKLADSVTEPEAALAFIARRRTGWQSLRLARALAGGEPTYFTAMNRVNHGAISNLPDDLIVETPAIVSSEGVKLLEMGALPAQIAPICQLHGTISNLVADAAATGSRAAALQALILDPYVRSMTVAESILDDILDYNRQYPTRFS